MNLVYKSAFFSFFLALASSSASADISPRIIGGSQDAAAGQFPSVVSIQILKKNSWQHTCTGTVIAPRLVLTAYHCVSSLDYGPDGKPLLRIVAGTTKPEQEEGQGEGTTIAVEHIAVHPQAVVNLPANISGIRFGPKIAHIRHDLAILRLAEDSPTESVPLLPAELLSLAAPGHSSMIVGWGYIDETPLTAPDTLQFAELVIRPDRQCSAYGKTFSEAKQTSLCAGRAGSNAVYAGGGDSGGPLFVEDENGKLYQLGVTSYTSASKTRPTMTMFMDVAAERAWIESVMHAEQWVDVAAPTIRLLSRDPVCDEAYYKDCDFFLDARDNLYLERMEVQVTGPGFDRTYRVLRSGARQFFIAPSVKMAKARNLTFTFRAYDQNNNIGRLVVSGPLNRPQLAHGRNS